MAIFSRALINFLCINHVMKTAYINILWNMRYINMIVIIIHITKWFHVFSHFSFYSLFIFRNPMHVRFLDVQRDTQTQVLYVNTSSNMLAARCLTAT